MKRVTRPLRIRSLQLLLLLGVIAWDIPSLARTIDPVNDQSIISQLSTEGGNLIEAKKVVPQAELIKELNRVQAKISLSANKPLVSNLSDLYAKAKPAVLVIGGIYKCDKCTRWHSNCAGGFALTVDGKAVTNYHVVNQPSNGAMIAMTGDGKMYPIKEVLAASKVDDVAIVQLDLPRGVSLQILPVAPSIQPGTHIQIISHPDSHFYTLTDGIVSRYANRAGSTWLCVTADYAKGSSGCPVMNDKGQVVGIVANTESIYYSEENGVQKNLQMVIRNCVPSAAILKLIAK
jgi:hypothetical protein